MMEIALASCAVLPEPDPDEAPLLAALRERDVRAAVLAWDDPSARFDLASLTIIRSTWNYHRTPARFARWVRDVAAHGPLFNRPEIVLWNMHKRYLLELSARGLPVLPTQLVVQGATESLAAIKAGRGWRDVVIKPAVSAGSRSTRHFAAHETVAGEAHLAAITGREDALVQPYVPQIKQRGERSLVWIDGEITHALRKAPRFEGDAEGITLAEDVTDAELALASRAIEMLPKSLFYARIDLVTGDDGPLLMELELIEPSLYFDASRIGLERFVEGVLQRYGASIGPSAKQSK
jgi:glutathione synthase/RimK-type ligase-like ATP-grasp enzyme